MTAGQMTLQYQRFQAPQTDGQTLQDPPLRELDPLWQANLRCLEDHSFTLFGQPISQVRDTARQDLVNAAVDYTSRYLDVDRASVTSERVVLAGHQPELFHPGVWYKHFALSSIARQVGATAINLIIDHDLCTATHISVPEVVAQIPRLKTLAFDKPGPFLPHQMRTLKDNSLWESFGDRVTEAVRPLINDPLIERVWPHVLRVTQRGFRPSHAIAAGRHSLENELGLTTLELPSSKLCALPAFFAFMAEIVSRSEQWLEIHNQALSEYRRSHRIRSATHPVPALTRVDGWTEVPFWIWSEQDPTRRRLFVSHAGGRLRLSDGQHIDIPVAPNRLDEQLADVAKRVYLRPRALTNTLYARLILGQLFLHGIGGAKYDQLTDSIASRFFDVELPAFMTLTSTNRLPIALPEIEASHLTEIDVKRRELVYHPELFANSSSEEVHRLISQKQMLIESIPPRGHRRSWQRKIESTNADLQPFVEPYRQLLAQEKQKLASDLVRKQVLGSREFSFCIFPASLAEVLRRSAS